MKTRVIRLGGKESVSSPPGTVDGRHAETPMMPKMWSCAAVDVRSQFRNPLYRVPGYEGALRHAEETPSFYYEEKLTRPCTFRSVLHLGLRP